MLVVVRAALNLAGAARFVIRLSSLKRALNYETPFSRVSIFWAGYFPAGKSLKTPAVTVRKPQKQTPLNELRNSKELIS